MPISLKRSSIAYNGNLTLNMFVLVQKIFQKRIVSFTKEVMYSKQNLPSKLPTMHKNPLIFLDIPNELYFIANNHKKQLKNVSFRRRSPVNIIIGSKNKPRKTVTYIAMFFHHSKRSSASHVDSMTCKLNLLRQRCNGISIKRYKNADYQIARRVVCGTSKKVIFRLLYIVYRYCIWMFCVFWKGNWTWREEQQKFR